MAPSLDLFQRLLATTGLYLVVVDQDGRIIQPMRECEHTRDGGDRRYPSHLDTILDPRPGEWWADQYGLARPPETFYRNREIRDLMRARSQWEVRVAQLRHAPEPPSLEMFYTRLEAERRRSEKGRDRVAEQIDSNDYDVDEYDDGQNGIDECDDGENGIDEYDDGENGIDECDDGENGVDEQT